MLKKATLLVSALTLFATGCAMDEELSVDNQESHAWGNYHWARSSNPFNVDLGDNLSSNWDVYLDDASADWSQSTVLNTTVVPGNTRPRTCKATTGMVEVCNDTYGNNGWLGIAGIYASGDHITKGYVKLNDTYFNTSTYNSSAWRHLVTCQEVGHTFGLAHQDENFNNPNLNTCMDYTSDPSSNQHPNNHDYQMLKDIYSHTDFSAPTSTPSDARQDEGDWGELVLVSENGNQETYVKSLGGDNYLITDVLWADGAHRVSVEGLDHTH